MAATGNAGLFDNLVISGLEGTRVVMVKTAWNQPIVDELEKGCIKVLLKYGFTFETITVPGAIEIPFAVKAFAEQHPDTGAIIALGCVIKGGTPHFEYVCQSVTQGLTALNIRLPMPVIFGVLTLNTEEQAWERLGGIHGHKGEEAAITAIQMMQVNQTIKRGTS